MSESEGGSSSANAETGFSPAQLAAIAGIVQKVLSDNRAISSGSGPAGNSAEESSSGEPGARRSHAPSAGLPGTSSELTAGEKSIHGDGRMWVEVYVCTYRRALRGGQDKRVGADCVGRH